MKIHNEQRQRKLDRRKRAWSGGSFSAQHKRAEINQGYAREPQAVIRARIQVRFGNDQSLTPAARSALPSAGGSKIDKWQSK